MVRVGFFSRVELMASSTMVAAAVPITSMGWRTVVSAGVTLRLFLFFGRNG